MLTLQFFCQFSSGCGFLIRSLHEFLAHNPIYHLHDDRAKSANEILIVLVTGAVVMIWATADIGETVLRFWPAGH
jgi:uncharacterized membrane protein